jgi:hypothetical protein
MKTTKFCSKCENTKDLSHFHSNKKSKDGKQCHCIECRKIVNNELRRKRYAKDPNYRKKVYDDCRRSRLKNPTRYKEYQKRYIELNKDSIQLSVNEWRQTNKTHLRKYWKNYTKERNKTDPEFHIKNILRKRIWDALNGRKKSASTEKLLGCSLADFRNYIQSRFTANMNWQHFESGEIHIDHIKPCASFDLSNPDEQKVCFHYTNLQPLWATTELAKMRGDFESVGNLNKGDSITSYYHKDNLSP